MKILVVDDEPVVAALVAESLRRQGHEPMIAHDAAKALQTIESASPDAVFLDLEMPGVGGVELLRRIRETHQALPVVVFARRASARELTELRRLGVADVVEKPIALAHLSKALDQLKRQRS